MKFSVYDAAGLIAAFIAIVFPNEAFYGFITSVFRVGAFIFSVTQPSTSPISNLDFTALELRAILLVFAIMFLTPRIMEGLKGVARHA